MVHTVHALTANEDYSLAVVLLDSNRIQHYPVKIGEPMWRLVQYRANNENASVAIGEEELKRLALQQKSCCFYHDRNTRIPLLSRTTYNPTKGFYRYR
jgi:hypothetical protein